MITDNDLKTDLDGLAGLGDALVHAARRDLRRGSSRRRRRVATLTVVACGGVAAIAGASGVFSSDDVAAGMPAGAAMFGGTHPICAAADSSGAFSCKLSSAPTEEILDDYMGTKEPLAIDSKVAGGCIGRDSAGLTWDCYLGEGAVRHGIISHGFLGQPETSPGHG
jgi:hypothetical protein